MTRLASGTRYNDGDYLDSRGGGAKFFENNHFQGLLAGLSLSGDLSYGIILSSSELNVIDQPTGCCISKGIGQV